MTALRNRNVGRSYRGEGLPEPPCTERFKLTIEYDGTDFYGWQSQPDVRTVQDELEAALRTIFQDRVVVYGAGRTDAGVHASGQVAHITLPRAFSLPRLVRGLNSILPRDVKILNGVAVPPTFHARFSARSRTYVYRVLRCERPLLTRFAWCPGFDWDDAVIARAVEMLRGRHSFISFSRTRPGEEGYICDIFDASWETDPEGSWFRITADRFMHRMVRGLMGALIDLGRGYYLSLIHI